MLPLLALLLALAWLPCALAAFGVTTTSASYVVDAGSTNSLVVTVRRSDCSITSLLYRGAEYQYASQASHIASGLGSATVSYAIVDNTYAVVTCVADNADFDLTHYYVVKAGDSTVYMATYTNAEPAVGELRYIARLASSLLPVEYPFGTASTTAGGTAIEGSDVFLVDGQTRSKFYSSQRFIDNSAWCFTDAGAATHACFITHPSRTYEKSAGGPFFRDINTNNNGDFSALTLYLHSGHVQTETARQGLHGPYALVFSRSGVPKSADVDFALFASLPAAAIAGYVADAARGHVSGTASGVAAGFDRVVHWSNANYQYWVYASSSGSFTSPAMVPGTYTMVLYQGELVVASQSVTVAAAATTTANIAATTSAHTTVFQIGDWDGRPTGFRNAASQLRMHPSDARMSAWGPLTYTVGSSSVADFPMAVFKDVNAPVTISFSLSTAIAAAATLRIGTTLAFAGGRPTVTVNGYSQAFAAPSPAIDSRGVTRGAYRGYGTVYDVAVPAGTLVAGANTITIGVISGSSGDDFLSPNFIFDCVELFH